MTEEVPVEASPTAVATVEDASREAAPRPTPFPTTTPSPTPTPDPRQARCAGLDERGATLGEDVEEVLDGHDGRLGSCLGRS